MSLLHFYCAALYILDYQLERVNSPSRFAHGGEWEANPRVDNCRYSQ